MKRNTLLLTGLCILGVSLCASPNEVQPPKTMFGQAFDHLGKYSKIYATLAGISTFGIIFYTTYQFEKRQERSQKEWERFFAENSAKEQERMRYQNFFGATAAHTQEAHEQALQDRERAAAKMRYFTGSYNWDEQACRELKVATNSSCFGVLGLRNLIPLFGATTRNDEAFNQVRISYRRLCREWHPDKKPQVAGLATKVTQLLNAAYSDCEYLCGVK